MVARLSESHPEAGLHAEKKIEESMEFIVEAVQRFLSQTQRSNSSTTLWEPASGIESEFEIYQAALNDESVSSDGFTRSSEPSAVDTKVQGQSSEPVSELGTRNCDIETKTFGTLSKTKFNTTKSSSKGIRQRGTFSKHLLASSPPRRIFSSNVTEGVHLGRSPLHGLSSINSFGPMPEFDADSENFIPEDISQMPSIEKRSRFRQLSMAFSREFSAENPI